ncbi:hypothetical protein RRG08_018301 [Elysia crispata]|uniref:Uncharacterized protein n=1 Tax=Elysia crispata TaxID=231223 RepID=A0AAE0YJG0_9GAST|nr:hypothetical protein RRG08_018301 [Elysia crispata]
MPIQFPEEFLTVSIVHGVTVGTHQLSAYSGARPVTASTACTSGHTTGESGKARNAQFRNHYVETLVLTSLRKTTIYVDRNESTGVGIENRQGSYTISAAQDCLQHLYDLVTGALTYPVPVRPVRAATLSSAATVMSPIHLVMLQNLAQRKGLVSLASLAFNTWNC